MKTKLIFSFPLLLSVGIGVTKLYANEVNFGDRIPTTSEIIEVLKPQADRQKVPRTYFLRTRSIRIEPVAVNQQTPVEQPASSQNAISMEVKFAFDSYQLAPEAINQLEPVVEAMSSSELASLKVLIEGHTDSHGSALYNQQLSERRAKSVKKYLMTHGVDSSRLIAMGRGKSMPLDPGNPTSSVNRRVRIVAQ
jgi:outer membrane protein OmpA-like peptidoglycan-associated protein